MDAYEEQFHDILDNLRYELTENELIDHRHLDAIDRIIESFKELGSGKTR